MIWPPKDPAEFVVAGLDGPEGRWGKVEKRNLGVFVIKK